MTDTTYDNILLKEARLASNDATKFLAGDGSFKTPTAVGNFSITLSGGNLVITGLPTSSTGLPTGAVWSNSGVLTIV